MKSEQRTEIQQARRGKRRRPAGKDQYSSTIRIQAVRSFISERSDVDWSSSLEKVDSPVYIIHRLAKIIMLVKVITGGTAMGN